MRDGPSVCSFQNRRMSERAQSVHALVVPDIVATAVAQESERQSAGRIGPAEGRADAAVPERARVPDGSQARMTGLTTGEWAETAMHRVAGVVVDEITGEVAGHIVDHSRRDDAHPIPDAALRHHLIEHGHRPRRRVAARPRDACAPEQWRRHHRVERPHLRLPGRVHRGCAVILRLGQAQKHLLG